MRLLKREKADFMELRIWILTYSFCKYEFKSEKELRCYTVDHELDDKELELLVNKMIRILGLKKNGSILVYDYCPKRKFNLRLTTLLSIGKQENLVIKNSGIDKALTPRNRIKNILKRF